MDAFNTYKKGADLQFMVDECLNRGKVLQLKKDETLERAGEPARWIGFIKSGYLKYVVTNPVEEKAYNTGFVFEGELVADYPNCLYGVPSDVTIVAGKDCTLMVIEGQSIQRMYEEDPHLMNIGKRIGEGLFLQTYTRLLNFYRTDASTRYKELLQRCPNIVQQLPLQEIASYLHVTPVTVSKIRKELLEKERGALHSLIHIHNNHDLFSGVGLSTIIIRFLGAKIQKQFVKCDILHKKLLLNAIFCIPIRFS